MATSPPTFNIVPAALLQNAENVVNHIQTSVQNLLESTTVEQTTFNNAIRPLADIDNVINSNVQYMALFQAVSPSSGLRETSSPAISTIDKAYLSIFQHEGLFALVDAVHSNPSHGQENILDEEITASSTNSTECS